MTEDDGFPSPVVAAFLRGFANYTEQHNFGRYHPPEPEMTFDRPPFVLTVDQLFTATRLSMSARAAHRRQVMLRRYPNFLLNKPPGRPTSLPAPAFRCARPTARPA